MNCWRSSPATGGSGRRFTAAARSRKRASISSTSNEAMAATVPGVAQLDSGAGTRSSTSRSRRGRRRRRRPGPSRRRPRRRRTSTAGSAASTVGSTAGSGSAATTSAATTSASAAGSARLDGRRLDHRPARRPRRARLERRPGRRARRAGPSAPGAARRPGGPRRAWRRGASAWRRRSAGRPSPRADRARGVSRARRPDEPDRGARASRCPTTTSRHGEHDRRRAGRAEDGAGAADTAPPIMPGSALVGRTPDRRAPADDVAPQLARRRAGTCPPAPQRRRQRAGVAAAAPQHHRAAGGGWRAAARRPRRAPATPAGRCGSRPAHHSTSSTSMLPRPATARLVEQHGLQRRPPAGQRGGQLGARVSVSASGPSRSSVGLQPHPPEPPGVVEPQPAAVVEAHDPAVPAGVVAVRRRTPSRSMATGVVVAQQPPGHAEVEPDRRPVGAHDEHLAAPVERPRSSHRRTASSTPSPTTSGSVRSTATNRAADERRRRPAGSARPRGPPARRESAAYVGTLVMSTCLWFAVLAVAVCVGMLYRRLPHRAALGRQGRHRGS